MNLCKHGNLLTCVVGNPGNIWKTNKAVIKLTGGFTG